MKQTVTLLISLCLLGSLAAQTSNLISDNLISMGQWDNDDLPGHTFGTFNDIWGYVANDREYVIMGSAAYIHFFDVTDPDNLVELIAEDAGSQTVWRDFKTYQNYAYAVSDGTSDGLRVFDLSALPNTVTTVYQDNSDFGSAHNAFIDEANGRLYIVGSNTEGNGVIVYDLTQDPANPTLMESINLGFYSHDIYVRDNIAYCSAGYDGYMIYDLTDPSNPVYVAGLSTNGYNHSSWLTEDGQYAIFAEEVPIGLPLGIMDLKEMAMDDLKVTTYFQHLLTEVEETADKNTPHNPFVLGNLAFVSYYEDGIHIYDLTNPEEPTLFGFYDTYPENTSYNGYAGCWGMYPYLPSGNLFASDMSHGLVSFRVKDDTATKKIPSFAKDLRIYPNPVLNTLNIQITESTTDDYQYMLTSSIGQTMLTASLSSNQVTLDMANYPKGMYFLTILSDTEIYTQKVVKE